MAIDQVRGEQSRANWIRSVVYRALTRHGLTGLPAFNDMRGAYDRLTTGRNVTERWRRKERSRRKRAEYHRQWRAGERGRQKAERDAAARRARQQADSVEWTWHENGSVQASDLEGLGCDAAFVSVDGEFRQTSRHDLRRVLSALRRAIWEDRNLILAPRYKLFLERYDPQRQA